MKINLIGTLFGTSGYAAHTRGLFKGLVELGHEVQLDVPTPPGWELMNVTDAELQAIKQEHFKDGYTVMIGLPQFWPLGMNLPSAGFAGYCVWEGENVPQHFIPHLERADKVIVPSQHVKDAIGRTVKHMAGPLALDASAWSRTFVVPHGVDHSRFRPAEWDDGGKFIFLANKGWAQGLHDRGGLQYVLKAFAEEFRQGEPVQLRCKINMAYAPTGWDLMAELRKLELPDNRADMALSTTPLDPEVVPQSFQGHVFVSASMAEGFNLPVLEAMACGIPPIVTGYGGHLDFVTEENGWLVKHSLAPVNRFWEYEGSSWAVPDLQHLRYRMRYAFENRTEVQEKAQKAIATAQQYSWRSSAEALIKVLEQKI